MIRLTGHKEPVLSFLGLGFPLVSGYFLQMVIGITDTMMVGWYSVEALAAVVLGHTYFICFWALGAGFGNAVLPLVASLVVTKDAL